MSFIPAHDFCDPNPCDNNGVCTNYKDSYKCSCPSGYIGLDCEIYQPDVSIQYKYTMFNRNNKGTLEFQGKQCYKDVANLQYFECPAMPVMTNCQRRLIDMHEIQNRCDVFPFYSSPPVT